MAKAANPERSHRAEAFISLAGPANRLGSPPTSVARAAATAALVVAGLYVLWTARSVLLLVFAGVLVAVMLRSAAEWLEQKLHVPGRWSLLLVLALLGALLVLGIWLRGPAIALQLGQLQDRLPHAVKDAAGWLAGMSWGRWLASHASEQLPRAIEVLPRVTGILSTTIGFLAGLVIVLFLGITIAAEPAAYCDFVENLFPVAARDAVQRVMLRLGRALRLWLVARLFSMCVVGLMAFAGLWALGIPLPGTLAALAALLTFIPNVGPFLSAIPPVLLAFSSAPRLALFVILLFSGIHAVEGFLVTPVAERTAVHLPPALTLSVQLLLAFTAGALGVALAAPITTVALTLLQGKGAKSEEPHSHL